MSLASCVVAVAPSLFTFSSIFCDPLWIISSLSSDISISVVSDNTRDLFDGFIYIYVCVCV